MALGIGGHAMPTYKFQVGQTVFIVPSLFRGSPTGRYLVTKKLPERDGELEYCVRSADEPYERVVGESELGELPFANSPLQPN
jgi:hypothetical protein